VSTPMRTGRVTTTTTTTTITTTTTTTTITITTITTTLLFLPQITCLLVTQHFNLALAPDGGETHHIALCLASNHD
jgi:hypothetical protein